MSSPLRPNADDVSFPAQGGERDWPDRPQSAPTEGVVEVPRGAYFIYPAPPPSAQNVSAQSPNAASDAWQGLNATDSVSSLHVPALHSARGGRKPRKKHVMWEVLRPLTPADIPLINQSLPSPRATLVQIRHTHHQLARLIAEGRPNNDAALLTGYTPAYVSVLKDDPSFQELVAHYAMQEELHHVDVLERMKMLGLHTLDTLQERLETEPDAFSNRELMEQAELMLVKPLVATRGGILPGVAAGPSSNGVTVSVNFIGSASPQPQPSDLQTRPDPPPPIIDLQAEKVTGG